MTPALRDLIGEALASSPRTLVAYADAQALLALAGDYRQWLCAEENQRLQRFVAAGAAREFAAARVLLRGLLGQLLDRPPAELAFALNSYGKPQLADPAAPRFNLSHSGGYVMVAIDPHDEIGVDMERQTRELDWRNIAAMVCSPEELDRLNSAEHFLHLWTQKEAIAKALGLGLSAPLAKIEGSRDTDSGWQRIALPADCPSPDLLVREIKPLPGLVAHLAVVGEPRTYALRRLV